MRDPVVSLLTVVVLGWVGTDLMVGARRAARRRPHTVALPRGVRFRSVRPAPFVRAAFDALCLVPPLRLALVAASFGLSGCGGGGLRVTSPDLRDGGALAERFTCTGDNAVPTLRWTGGPAGTRSWAVVVEDPDAPRGTFTHWVVTGLGAEARSTGQDLPLGAVASLTSSGKAGYVGPCPPTGEEHRFRYRVHALGELLTLEPATPVAEARRRIEAASLDASEVEVTYQTP